MRLLVTGLSGFVGLHFLRCLDEAGVEADVLGISRRSPTFTFEDSARVRCGFRQLDMLDQEAVGTTLNEFRPSHVLHLAAYSSVGFSWQKPVESFANNTNILLNLLDQVRRLKLSCRVLSVGSSEEYGNVDPEQLPLREAAPLHPVSPYAVARVAQEMISRVYVAGYGLDVVMTRSFNHIGPHQRDAFVVSSFAKQLVAIKYHGATPKVLTGDRSIVRDFIDVRDVVRAYLSLLNAGTAGEIYNVCSGQGATIQSIVDTMQDILGTQASIETDPALVRPSDNRVIVGCNDKLRRQLGWQPRIKLRESLVTILDWWREELAPARGRAD